MVYDSKGREDVSMKKVLRAARQYYYTQLKCEHFHSSSKQTNGNCRHQFLSKTDKYVKTNF